MRDPRSTEIRLKSRGSQAPNVIPMSRAQAPAAEQQLELLTASEAMREFGLNERHLYAWVANGVINAYRTAFVKWPLYSKMEIIRALQLAFSVAEKAA